MFAVVDLIVSSLLCLDLCLHVAVYTVTVGDDVFSAFIGTGECWCTCDLFAEGTICRHIFAAFRQLRDDKVTGKLPAHVKTLHDVLVQRFIKSIQGTVWFATRR